MWGLNATSVRNTFLNFTVRVTTTGQTLRHNPCSFNGTQGRYLTVIYDNVRSNTIRFSGTASGEVDTPPPERPPSEPRNVNADAHSTRQLRVTWSAPSNSGSAAIKHYTVRYSRPAIGTSGPWRSRLYTTTSNSHTSPNLRFGTTYTVAVTAVNRDDRASSRATDTATTPGTIPTEPVESVTFDPVSVDPPPITSTVESHSSSRSSGWIRMDDNCGFWLGCRDHYYIGTGHATATWYMGDLQGVFTFAWKNPKDSVTNLRGHAVWKIYEKRTGSNSWRHVKTFRPNVQSEQKPDRWWGYRNSRLELDGQVKIEVSHDHNKRYGSIGIRRARLKFVDILPELKPAAIEMCDAGVVKALSLATAIPLSVVAATIIVAVAPAGASAIATSLSKEGLRRLVEYGAKKSAEAFGIWAGQKAAGVDDPISKLTLVDAATELAVDWAENIWTSAVESYKYGCHELQADWMYLGITRGYGNYADDLAEVFGRRR